MRVWGVCACVRVRVCARARMHVTPACVQAFEVMNSISALQLYRCKKNNFEKDKKATYQYSKSLFMYKYSDQKTQF